MSNPATLAAPFTKENARAMALRSHAARRLNRERENIFRANAAPAPDDARRAQALKQLDALDVMINDAINKGNEAQFLKLINAKEKLWKLVQPTAGVNRPARPGRQSRQPMIQPVETPKEPMP